jgi:hypothetical protein
VLKSRQTGGLPFLFQDVWLCGRPREQSIDKICHLLGLSFTTLLCWLIYRCQSGELASHVSQSESLYGMVSTYVQSRDDALSISTTVALLMGISNLGCIYIDLGMEEQAIHRAITQAVDEHKASGNKLPGMEVFFLPQSPDSGEERIGGGCQNLRAQIKLLAFLDRGSEALFRHLNFVTNLLSFFDDSSRRPNARIDDSQL